jgi:hypothetical protein
MTTWEVSIIGDLSARTVVRKDVPQSELLEAYKHASVVASGYTGWGRPRSVMLTRSDHTPEARRARWEAAFYDLDRRGYRRRRFRKSQTERDWEAFFVKRKQDRLKVKTSKKNGVIECKLCSYRWYYKASQYGLVHRCGEGLVKSE